MGEGCEKDLVASLHGLSEPSELSRPLVAGCEQHGPSMANPAEPAHQSATTDPAEQCADLDGVCQADEVFVERSSEKTKPLWDMDVLGEATVSDSAPLHLETEPWKNLRKMRPVDVVRMVNTTPFGMVLNERQLYRHRLRAGDRIGSGKKLDFCAYVAWLSHERRKSRSPGQRPVGDLTVRSILELLEYQGYRCALSGRPLTPDTVALDHVIPVCHGGQHCMENAQILHKDVNRAKGTMMNEAFIRLCRDVASHSSPLLEES